MSSFDPMAAAIDWLDAYRANDLSNVELYAPNASLECGCNGQITVSGRNALTKYWRQWVCREARRRAAGPADGRCRSRGVIRGARGHGAGAAEIQRCWRDNSLPMWPRTGLIR